MFMDYLVRFGLAPVTPMRTTPFFVTVVFGVRKIFWRDFCEARPRLELMFDLSAILLR